MFSAGLELAFEVFDQCRSLAIDFILSIEELFSFGMELLLQGLNVFLSLQLFSQHHFGPGFLASNLDLTIKLLDILLQRQFHIIRPAI